MTADPDVEDTIRDLVGVKVLCKSPRDQQLIMDACLNEERLDALELVEHKDYVTRPKSSGYRAMHLVLSVPVDGEAPVYTEIQVKTRLQDAWGELTYEDMYKPAGGALRPGRLHRSVASTMSALLAEVDALADELATELSEHELEPSLPVSARPEEGRSEWSFQRSVTLRAVRSTFVFDGLAHGMPWQWMPMDYRV